MLFVRQLTEGLSTIIIKVNYQNEIINSKRGSS